MTSENKLTEWESWKNEVDECEKACPWLGPRPYTSEDNIPYRGRLEEGVYLVTQLRDSPLGFLHGYSAVGKSSFLTKRLVPTLRANGNIPLLCTTWPSTEAAMSDKEDSAMKDPAAWVDKYLANVILEESNCGHLINEWSDAENGENRYRSDLEDSNIGVLNALTSWEMTPVLILDQFEEFLRANSSQQRKVRAIFDWIAEANTKYGSKIKVILSFRSEFLTEVEPLKRMLTAHSYFEVKLDPILELETIKEIIADGALKGVSVEKSVEKKLCELWKEHKEGSTALFHLQAQLFALYWVARESGVSTAKVKIKEEHLTHLDYDDAKAKKDSEKFVTTVFKKIFDIKMAHCREALGAIAKGTRIPAETIAYLVEEQIRRLAPHLSVNTFKERKSLWDLLKLSHAREYAELILNEDRDLKSASSKFSPFTLSKEEAEKMTIKMWENKERLLDLDMISWAKKERFVDILESLDAQLPCIDTKSFTEQWQQWRSIFTTDRLPWLEDPKKSSAGPVLGFQYGEVFIILIKIHLLAVSWLAMTNVAKFAYEQVQLVHDQLGEAITNWAESEKTGKKNPWPALISPTAIIGERLRWSTQIDHKCDICENGSRYGIYESETSPYVANAVIQRSAIEQVHFKKIRFVNCDFSLTRFYRCIFENVQFVNCLLDGAIFDNCKIVGYPSQSRIRSIFGREKRRRAIYEGYMPEFWASARDGVSEFEEYDLRGAADVLRSLAYFRDVEFSEDDSVLYSTCSGVPAICGSAEIDVKPKKEDIPIGELTDLGGGLVILGGRIAGITAINLEFKESSSFVKQEGSGLGLVFAFTSGSAVDFVENEQLRLWIYGSAIRGLSVSRPVKNVKNKLAEDAIRISVEDSVLSGPFMSFRLNGEIDASSDSWVYGYASLSEYDDDEKYGLKTIGIYSEKETVWLEEGADEGLPVAKQTMERRRIRMEGLWKKTDYRSEVAEIEFWDRWEKHKKLSDGRSTVKSEEISA